jgi:hypothetical protein
MFERIFLSHPRSVGDSYAEHAASALSIGRAMVAGGLACMIHAVIPALFTHTASDTIEWLHARTMTRKPVAIVREFPGD